MNPQAAMSKVEALAWQLLVKTYDAESPLFTDAAMEQCIETAERFCNKLFERQQKAMKNSVATMVAKCEKAYADRGKIFAVKKFRDLTGQGVKEAKDQVEAWEQQLGWKEQYGSEKEEESQDPEEIPF